MLLTFFGMATRLKNLDKSRNFKKWQAKMGTWVVVSSALRVQCDRYKISITSSGFHFIRNYVDQLKCIRQTVTYLPFQVPRCQMVTLQSVQGHTGLAHFKFFDIRTLWCSVLSPRVPECQKGIKRVDLVDPLLPQSENTWDWKGPRRTFIGYVIFVLDR